MYLRIIFSWIKVALSKSRPIFFIFFVILAILQYMMVLDNLVIYLGINGEERALVAKFFDSILFSGSKLADAFWMTDIAFISVSLVVMLKKDVGLAFRLFLIVVLLSYPLLIHGLWLIRIML